MDRFWNKVVKGPSCWEWTAAKNKAGYGIFQIGTNRKQKTILAHRFSMELIHGSTPIGMAVCHHCDNPACVRPEHLFIGSMKDNMRDSANKGRHPKNKTRYLPEGKRHHFYKRGMKITREEALRIRSESGTQISIAHKHGVSPSLVSLIKSGHIWK